MFQVTLNHGQNTSPGVDNISLALTALRHDKSFCLVWNYVNSVLILDKHDDVFILTIDADVRFTPADVIALMDRMSRNHRVGAVCGRTHPLGSGRLVWYQVFDYAIGHWMLKVGKHGAFLMSHIC